MSAKVNNKNNMGNGGVENELEVTSDPSGDVDNAEEGDDDDDDDDEVTLLESSHKNSDDNTYESKECDDTKEDNMESANFRDSATSSFVCCSTMSTSKDPSDFLGTTWWQCSGP